MYKDMYDHEICLGHVKIEEEKGEPASNNF